LIHINSRFIFQVSSYKGNNITEKNLLRQSILIAFCILQYFAFSLVLFANGCIT